MPHAQPVIPEPLVRLETPCPIDIFGTSFEIGLTTDANLRRPRTLSVFIGKNSDYKRIHCLLWPSLDAWLMDGICGLIIPTQA